MDLTKGAAYLGVIGMFAGVWIAMEESDVLLTIYAIFIGTASLRMHQLQSWVNDHVAECDDLRAN